MKTRRRTKLLGWVSLVAFLAVSVADARPGPRSPLTFFGGGGTVPLPPIGAYPPFPVPPDHVTIQKPIFIMVSGPEAPYSVQIRIGAHLIAQDVTDSNGLVVFMVPDVPGLVLDVLGTSVVDIPVKAGHVVQIVVR